MNKYVQFALRAGLVAAAYGLSYIGANASDVADPGTSGIVVAVAAAAGNLVHSLQVKYGKATPAG